MAKEKKQKIEESQEEIIEESVEDQGTDEEVLDQMAEIESIVSKDSNKIFGLYDLTNVVVEDPGLKRVINLEPRLMLKTYGKTTGKFAAAKINLVERLIRILCHPGHRGKKHRIMTRTTGMYNKNAKVVLKAFKIIEEKTKKNPVQVLVKAIEMASPREEVTTIEYGGAKYPQAVDSSPLRRVSLTLRLMIHGAHDKSFNKKTKISEALANEIMFAADGKSESFAVSKKSDAEKQANSAR